MVGAPVGNRDHAGGELRGADHADRGELRDRRQQSQPLTTLAERDDAVTASLARIEREPTLVAPGWTLYSLRPETVEFWQGDRQRRHTRLFYRASDAGWTRQLLWP